MNPDVKQAWIAALEGGEYEQGNSRLSYQDGIGTRHCCMGVLCDLAVKAGVVESRPEISQQSGEETGTLIYGAYSTAYMPIEVATWAGLDTNPDAGNPTFTWHGRVSNLAALNDVERYDFRTIARVIKDTL